MRRFGSLLLCVPFLMGAAPSRQVNYQPGSVIKDTENESNEDAIFTYLQAGVDVIADGAVGTADLATSAVTSSKILDGTVTGTDIADGTITNADLALTGILMPSGAIFFMITGSCPSGTTDVTATYNNLFIRANATQGTLIGSDTHTHGVGSYTTASHNHGGSTSDVSRGLAWNASSALDSVVSTSLDHAATGGDYNSATISTQSSAAITGTSASGSTIPAAFTAKLCQVQ